MQMRFIWVHLIWNVPKVSFYKIFASLYQGTPATSAALQGAPAGGAAAPAPPPAGAPPPPPPPAIDPPAPAPATSGGGDEAGRSALFAALNKGSDVTKGWFLTNTFFQITLSTLLYTKQAI